LGFAAGDSNLYRYVHNSPTNATDPSGRFLFVGAAIGGVFGAVIGGVGAALQGGSLSDIAVAAGKGALVGGDRRPGVGGSVVRGRCWVGGGGRQRHGGYSGDDGGRRGGDRSGRRRRRAVDRHGTRHAIEL
jgi:hypothetical protein